MSSKRKYEEDATPQVAVHSSRQFQVPGSIPKPAKKPRRLEPSASQKHASGSGVNAIKKRLRDVRRKLERSADLPADLRIESERALADYEHELAAAEAEKLRQKMIAKYHMVRFFERQKATRLLKKLRKQLLETTSTEEVDRLKAQMHITEVDLNYAQFCPLAEIYVSLYPPKNGEEEEEDQSPRPKPPMWAVVEKAMEDGTLNQLRNRVPNMPAKVPKKQIHSTKPVKVPAAPTKERLQRPPIDTTGMNRRQRRKELGIAVPKKAREEMYGVKRTQSYAIPEERFQRAEVEDDGEDGKDGGGFFTEG